MCGSLLNSETRPACYLPCTLTRSLSTNRIASVSNLYQFSFCTPSVPGNDYYIWACGTLHLELNHNRLRANSFGYDASAIVDLRTVILGTHAKPHFLLRSTAYRLARKEAERSRGSISHVGSITDREVPKCKAECGSRRHFCWQTGKLTKPTGKLC